MDAENQGTISLGETIEAELEVEVSHAWTFNEGPVVIDVILESSEDLDAVLEIYDPDNNFITVITSYSIHYTKLYDANGGP